MSTPRIIILGVSSNPPPLRSPHGSLLNRGCVVSVALLKLAPIRFSTDRDFVVCTTDVRTFLRRKLIVFLLIEEHSRSQLSDSHKKELFDAF